MNSCCHDNVVISSQTLYPVESAVASVREETERVAEKILSEQVKDHQSSQSVREQWMQDTSKVVHLCLLARIVYLISYM